MVKSKAGSAAYSGTAGATILYFLGGSFGSRGDGRGYVGTVGALKCCMRPTKFEVETVVNWLCCCCSSFDVGDQGTIPISTSKSSIPH